MEFGNASCEEIAQCYKLYNDQDVIVPQELGERFTVSEVCNHVMLGKSVQELLER